MSDVELKRTQVDLSGLLEVLGKNLYSTPTVAVRELVQNAHDSCLRRRLEGEPDHPGRIVVGADPERGLLVIEDDGAGLTRDEIERYLATVGAGYTRRLREEHQHAGLIGMFGLGFLSAFVVSERVEVVSTSRSRPDEAWRFSSRDGQRYSLAPAASRPVGTRVELALTPRFRELSAPDTVRELLARYCSLLPVPIYLASGPGEEPAGPPVNAARPPWHPSEDSPLRRKKLELEFAQRFEKSFAPITCLPLEAGSSPEGQAAFARNPARGLLWIQDGSSYGTSDHRNASVFVRGMLVSQDERDLLPSYAGFAGVVVECDSLSPTASREDLQRDQAYQDVALQVREALIRGLSLVASSEPAAWRRILARHNEALLGAALCDDRLLALLADELTVPTSEGDLPLAEVLRRGQGKLHLSVGERGSYEETLFRALGVPVVNGTRYAAYPFSTRYAERRGAQLVRLGTREGNAELFRREALPPAELARLERCFARPGQEIVPARFLPAALPLVLIPDREVLLKERLESDDADRRISSALLGMARLFTQQVDGAVRARLFVNLDSLVIRRLLQAEEGAPRVEQVAAILRGLCRLMSSHGDQVGEKDLAQALEELADAAAALLA